MEPFQLDAEQGVFWLQSWAERYPQLRVGFTTRQLGNDLPYGNLALHVGDVVENVLQNRKYIANLVQLPVEAITCANQTHGAQTVEVGEERRGAGALQLESSIPDTDGLVTNRQDTMLMLFFADCVPIYFFDKEKQAFGIAHAGWRGTVQNIATKMVQKFQEMYDSKPYNIHVAIGPSIGACCYQVDQRVMDAVNNVLHNEGHAVAKADGSQHYRLDLKKMNQILLERAGILSSHIEVSELCTSCQSHYFFSYRREPASAGRMAAFAVWKGGEV